MDPVRRETDTGTAPEFVALDIRGDAGHPCEADEELMVDASFPAVAKAIERERNGDANPPSTGVVAAVGVHEKQQQGIDGSPWPEHLHHHHHHPSTPTAGGAKRRRAGRRIPAVWRDPRKILFAFAALSSVGTLVLLYFTLSMGKMSSAGQGDGE